MLLNSKKVDIGMPAIDFELKSVDNEIYTKFLMFLQFQERMKKSDT